jgi:hypothetical protein
MSRYVTRAVQALQAYTPGEQPQAAGIVKLNTNENPYPPSPAVGQALAALDPARLRLYPNPLCTTVRERIASIHGCSSRQVFVGNGSDEILALCTRAFVLRSLLLALSGPGRHPEGGEASGRLERPFSLADAGAVSGVVVLFDQPQRADESVV